MDYPARRQPRGKPKRWCPKWLRRLLRPWARVTGTVYAFRCERHKPHWWARRTSIGYVGKYAGPWKERIRQHLYGGGPYQCKPQPWADLVDGYDPNARSRAAQMRVVNRVIANGAAFIVWQKPCFYWYIKVRESMAIAGMRPAFNYLENTHNRKRVEKWRAIEDRAKRDAGQMVADAEWAREATGIRRLPDGRVECYGRGWVEVG